MEAAADGEGRQEEVADKREVGLDEDGRETNPVRAGGIEEEAIFTSSSTLCVATTEAVATAGGGFAGRVDV